MTLNGRTPKRLKGVYGDIEQMNVPVAIKEKVQLLINDYKKECLDNADDDFNIKSLAAKIRTPKPKYSTIKELIAKCTRIELIGLCKELRIDLDKKYHRRDELELMIFDFG